MKYIHTLALIALASVAQAQTDTAVTYTSVVTVDAVSQAELFQRAKSWMATAPNESKIESEDKEAGTLVGKGNIRYTSKKELANGYIRYSVLILVKDGKYKYEITRFTHDGDRLNGTSALAPREYDFGLITTSNVAPDVQGSVYSWDKAVWEDLKIQTDTYAKQIVESLAAAMSKKSDW